MKLKYFIAHARCHGTDFARLMSPGWVAAICSTVMAARNLLTCARVCAVMGPSIRIKRSRACYKERKHQGVVGIDCR